MRDSEHISEDQHDSRLVINRLSVSTGVYVYEWIGRSAVDRPLRYWVFRHGAVDPHAALPLPAFERLQWQSVTEGPCVGHPRTTPVVDNSASQTTGLAYCHYDPRNHHVTLGAGRLQCRLAGRHDGLSAGGDRFLDVADSRSPGDRAVTIRQRSVSH